MSTDNLQHCRRSLNLVVDQGRSYREGTAGMSCTGSRDEIDPRENRGMGEPGLGNTSGFDRKEVPLARRWPGSGVDAM